MTPADISDSAGAQVILDGIRKRWPWVKHLFADGAYDRLKLDASKNPSLWRLGVILLLGIDNWRFYPDAGHALQKWARRNDQTVTLVESFVADRKADVWNDFCAVFVKGDPVVLPDERVRSRHSVKNVFDCKAPGVKYPSAFTEDQLLVRSMAAD